MRYSLRQDIAVEPVIAGWYGWSYLLPPQTLARFVRNRFTSIIDSYLSDPQVHATAVRQRKMHGGPWVHAYEHYDRIASWYQAAAPQRERLGELFDAIRQVEEEILPRYHGECLDPVYQELPSALAGRLEVFYGRDNRTADYRFIEPLMYASEYYDETWQQVRFGPVTRDAREFALTTPMLEYTPDQLLVDVPLNSPLLDLIFRGGLTEAELADVTARFGLTDQRAELFASYFEPAPQPTGTATGDVLEYVGHACVFARHDGTTFLVDPVLSYGGYPGGAEHRFTFADLPERIDYLLITHNHQDHMLFETLIRIRHRVGTVLIPKSSNASLVDPGLGGILRRLGFSHVVEVDDLDTLDCGSAQVVALPFLGEHGDLRIRSKTGWLIRFGERSVLFAADSTNIAPTMYAKVAEVIGRVDTVFIGMESIGAAASWIYGPLYGTPLDRRTDQSRRLNGSNFQQAKDIVDALDPDEVYVYAMGLEPWLGVVMAIDYDENHPAIVDSDLLVKHVRDKGRTADRLQLRRTLRR
ncbi:polyketide synthase [Micromonospora sp. ATCC 39149]|uniref:MBL fold metallo-hydrolase n=1 Tax=Micromonospora carbonacea TaxID=47853 RepID=A0A7D6GA34_9ACTN|nr:MBL fold metallo-hydrolase [Micromonospora sp. ATCC 39149]EEP74977.1 polyketide synthase [Micromonospora sp. ATCC 39149]QLK00723.1 MBL fold metallo-hydrolase [Micromonospora carbonacea]